MASSPTISNKRLLPLLLAMSSHESDSESEAPEVVTKSTAKDQSSKWERAMQDFRIE